jgi:hypothetical protein
MSIKSKARRLSLIIKASVLLVEIGFGVFLIWLFYSAAGIGGLFLMVFFVPAIFSLPGQVAQLLDLIGNAPVQELRYQRWEQQLEEQQAREQGHYTIPTRR